MAQQGGGGGGRGRGGARVPKFGEWGNQKGHGEQQNPVPYTMYFDNARKDKQQQSAGGGAIKIMNPNDPEENLGMFSPISKPTPPRVSSDRDHRKEAQPQPQPQPQRSNRRSTASSYGSEQNSFDRSPLHPHYSNHNQAIRTTPGREPNNINSSTSTPPRTRNRRPGTGSREDLSQHAVIPKFGAWNEMDPSSAEGLTEIFEKSRHEKHYGSSDRPPYNNIITTPTRQPAKPSDHSQHKMCFCFPW